MFHSFYIYFMQLVSGPYLYAMAQDLVDKVFVRVHSKISKITLL